NSPLVNVQMGGAWIESDDPQNDNCIFTCEDFASSSRAEAFAIMAALVTAPHKCHVTICTDSMVCIQQMEKIINKKRLKWEKIANSTLWSFINWIIQKQKLSLSMVKIKAHSGDLLNDLTDKLAKDSYKYNYPNLSISNDFRTQQTMVKWSNVLIEKPHREFMKQLYQAKYFNRFMSLNRNARIMSLTVNDTIDWKLSFFFFNYNGNKLSTDFDSSGLKVFKLKCLTNTLPTLTVLKTRYPFIYNNYDWSCPYNVETIDYGNIKSYKRCKKEEDFTHLWTCSHVKPIVSKIIEDFKLRVLHNIRELYSNINITIMKAKINRLHCLMTPTIENIDFINLTKGLIPTELVLLLHNEGCSLQHIKIIISENLNKLLRQFHQDIWIPRCKLLNEKEKEKGIIPAHKKRGNFKVNPFNLTFPIIKYLDRHNNSIAPHCDNDLWYNWTIYSCRAGKPWQDF